MSIPSHTHNVSRAAGWRRRLAVLAGADRIEVPCSATAGTRQHGHRHHGHEPLQPGSAPSWICRTWMPSSPPWGISAPVAPAPAPPLCRRAGLPAFSAIQNAIRKSLAAEAGSLLGRGLPAHRPCRSLAQLRGGDRINSQSGKGASPTCWSATSACNCHAGCKSTSAAGSRPRLRQSSNEVSQRRSAPCSTPLSPNPPTAYRIRSLPARPRRSGEPAPRLNPGRVAATVRWRGEGPSRRWSTAGSARPDAHRRARRSEHALWDQTPPPPACCWAWMAPACAGVAVGCGVVGASPAGSDQQCSPAAEPCARHLSPGSSVNSATPGWRCAMSSLCQRLAGAGQGAPDLARRHPEGAQDEHAQTAVAFVVLRAHPEESGSGWLLVTQRCRTTSPRSSWYRSCG